MKVKINPDWEKLLKEEFNKDYFKSLVDFIKQENVSYSICYYLLLIVINISPFYSNNAITSLYLHF